MCILYFFVGLHFVRSAFFGLICWKFAISQHFTENLIETRRKPTSIELMEVMNICLYILRSCIHLIIFRGGWLIEKKQIFASLRSVIHCRCCYAGGIYIYIYMPTMNCVHRWMTGGYHTYSHTHTRICRTTLWQPDSISRIFIRHSIII